MERIGRGRPHARSVHLTALIRAAARVAAARGGRGLVLAALALVAATVVLPIIVILAGSFWSGALIRMSGGLTLDNYTRFLTAERTRELMGTTLVMTIGSTLLAMFLGGLQAWIIARTDVPLRGLMRWLPVAPILTSALVTNIGFIALYSPNTGLVNVALMRAFGFEGPVFDIYSMPGLILVLGTHLAPIPYLILLGPMSSLGQALEEASRASGAGALRTFRHVTLPLMTPALLAATTLVAVLTSHAFETPVLIGLPAELPTYMLAIFRSMASSLNYSAASAQAIVYLILIGALLLWNRRLTRTEARFAVVGGRGYRPRVAAGGVSRYFSLAIVVTIFIASFGQVVAANVLISVVPYYTTTGPLPAPTLEHYRTALHAPRSLQAIMGSLLLAAQVALLCGVVATFLAFVAFKTRIAGRRLAEEIGTLPIAFPPLVFSMALLITFLSVPGLAALYNTTGLLVLALVVVFLPLAVRSIGSAMIAIEDELVEASASSGASTARTLWTIVIPLISTALTGGVALVFIFSFRELGAIALVTPPNMQLLPLHIYGLWQGGFPEVYALNVISFMLVVLMFFAMRLVVFVIGRAVRRPSTAW